MTTPSGTKGLLRRAAAYAGVGFAAEVAFSALHDAARGRPVRPRTSPLMLPVYALIAPLYEPLHDRLRARPATSRGAVYALGFFSVEYASGRAFRSALGQAPWDYSEAKLNIHGLVRLDYALPWALFGLALEPLHDHLMR